MMEWYNILAIVLGSLGGLGGVTSAFVSFFNAKSNKTTIDIANYQKLVEDIRAERETERQEHLRYKQEVHDKVEEVKKDFEKLRYENDEFKKSIMQAYRCPLPARLEDCPVIQLYEKLDCKQCKVE